jgi:hypothetical protein
VGGHEFDLISRDVSPMDEKMSLSSLSYLSGGMKLVDEKTLNNPTGHQNMHRCGRIMFGE